ncbi:hypothetical protein [Bailinhaonella thermotolerans]|nr:hypothetical protein [Bailinhaonella thermotolerans]
MVIDCARCELRDLGCGDCVVPVVLTFGRRPFELGEGELRALDALAEVGMVPPLRLALPEARAS